MSENTLTFEKQIYNVTEIMSVLPHRFPFLLVDRVTEITENGGKGFKNATMNEAFFQGHFPGHPIYPGVLIIEGMAQCAGFIALKILEAREAKSEGPKKQKLIFFASIDGVKFRNPVSPGDRLEYEVEVVKLSSRLGKFKGVTKVDGKVCTEAEMVAVMADKED